MATIGEVTLNNLEDSIKKLIVSLRNIELAQAKLGKTFEFGNEPNESNLESLSLKNSFNRLNTDKGNELFLKVNQNILKYYSDTNYHSFKIGRTCKTKEERLNFYAINKEDYDELDFVSEIHDLQVIEDLEVIFIYLLKYHWKVDACQNLTLRKVGRRDDGDHRLYVVSKIQSN
jgi:hypothetical protein